MPSLSLQNCDVGKAENLAILNWQLAQWPLGTTAPEMWPHAGVWVHTGGGIPNRGYIPVFGYA